MVSKKTISVGWCSHVILATAFMVVSGLVYGGPMVELPAAGGGSFRPWTPMFNPVAPTVLGGIQQLLQTDIGRGAGSYIPTVNILRQLRPDSEAHLRIVGTISLPGDFDSRLRAALQSRETAKLADTLVDLLGRLQLQEVDERITQAARSRADEITAAVNQGRMSVDELSAAASELSPFSALSPVSQKVKSVEEMAGAARTGRTIDAAQRIAATLLQGKSAVDAAKGQALVIPGTGQADDAKLALARLQKPDSSKSEIRLEAALGRIYQAANGGRESGKVDVAKLTTPQRIAFFGSQEFKDWVASERGQGKQVFWLRDMDKTQTAGDIFTFFFRWRAENGKITAAQNETLKSFLKTVAVNDQGLKQKLGQVDQNDPATNAKLVMELWRSKEAGGEGIDLLQFWRDIYWPTQKGLTQAEKLEQVSQFAPYFASKVYPNVREENLTLRRAGVEVLLVSNGDQELAQAVAPLLGLKRRNVVGSNLIYEKGVATGVNHSYELFYKEVVTKPQPGKPLVFHYWLDANKRRWGWESLDLTKVVIGGADGDSASTDGGMMMLQPPGSAIGNFMIDTPHEPNRVQKFYTMAKKYGWTPGQFFTLAQDPVAPGAWEGPSLEFAPYASVRVLRLKSIPTRIAYSVLNRVADWSKGHTTVFVGKKRTNKADGTPYASGAFLVDLKSHVEKTLSALRRQGLLSYIIYATGEMEFAVMTWESEDHMNKAFQSEKGKAVATDAGRIFEPQPMVWEKMDGFVGTLTAEVLEKYLRRVKQ